jgi:glycogen debranching enzyme
MAKLTSQIRDMNEALHMEWLEANGLGDYASGTACGCNARRYHGLLVANLDQIGRHVLLSSVEDWLDADGVTIDSAVSTWSDRMLQPYEVGALKGVAPTPKAVDMMFYVRRARR